MIHILAQSLAREIFSAVAIAVLTAAGVKAIDEGAEALKRRRAGKAPEPEEKP